MNGQGVYFYFCTQSSCGVGHSNMSGSFTVGGTGVNPGDKY